MSAYIAEIKHALDFIQIHDLPYPDGILADDSWMSIKWGNGVTVSRSHGDPTWKVDGPKGNTEHTSLIHAILRAKALLA